MGYLFTSTLLVATTLAVSLDAILAQLPLALNVHKSVEEVSVYVACGDLS